MVVDDTSCKNANRLVINISRLGPDTVRNAWLIPHVGEYEDPLSHGPNYFGSSCRVPSNAVHNAGPLAPKCSNTAPVLSPTAGPSP